MPQKRTSESFMKPACIVLLISFIVL